jgi:hypothetical protein
MRPLALCCLLALLMAAPATAGDAASPVIDRLTANDGPQAGGNRVVIEGTGLQGESPVQQVTFGGRAAERFTVESDTRITAVAPPGRGEVEVRVSSARGESPASSPAARYAYDPPPEGPWLGLNGNSLRYLGPVDRFVEDGVLYDRSNGIDWTAGESFAEGGQALWDSISAGMAPVITLEPKAFRRCDPGQDCLPGTAAAITVYVTDFISSAREILARYPAAPILLEVINEPWLSGTAGQYAALLASLLPAASRAGLPLDRIYAGAKNAEWIAAMYKARPQLQSEVAGWYTHLYPQSGPAEGVASLPALQAEMTSGQGNLIVSEIGFCAPDVNDAGSRCPPPALPAVRSAEALQQELRAAVPFHDAGWLRALIVYSRNDRGWAMQLKGGALTPSGVALEGFARSQP